MATRSVWSGHLSFGLVVVPIKLFVAARQERIDLHMLHEPCMSGVKQKYVCEACGEEVPRNGDAKFYDYGGAKVVLRKSEIDGCDPESSKLMSVLQFVKTERVDPLYFESSFYVAPDEAGLRALALLERTMRQSQLSAIARITMSSREHVVLLRPSGIGMMMHHLFYENEVRVPDRIPNLDAVELKEEELRIARVLVDQMVGEFDLEQFEDGRARNLMRLIEARHSGSAVEGNVVTMPRETPDLLQALKASMAAKRSA